ncbi:MAG TPA: hypothetical protein VF020_21385 [Chthoniobacterales bacterium]
MAGNLITLIYVTGFIVRAVGESYYYHDYEQQHRNDGICAPQPNFIGKSSERERDGDKGQT